MCVYVCVVVQENYREIQAIILTEAISQVQDYRSFIKLVLVFSNFLTLELISLWERKGMKFLRSW